MKHPDKLLFGSLAASAWLWAGSAVAGLVANPSFEESYNPNWPHYGPIAAWSGGSGTNRPDGPFHNSGTPITDGQQAAFIQNSNTLSQTISGLTAGQSYWIQFFYDARSCCGGSVDLVTRWDGAALDTISGVTASSGGNGYKFRNVVLTPSSDSGVLAFATLAAGDATALLDAVCLVPREAGQVVLMNPSFEASGTPASLGPVAGWTGAGAGSAGINAAGGPLANNGTVPEQDHVGFMTGDMAVSQTLRGLVAGETYAVNFRYNASTGNTPRLEVSVDGSPIFAQNVTAVGGAAAYRTGTANFTASTTTAVLTFSQTAVGDQTVLLDNIKVSGVVVEPLPNLKVGPAVLELGPGFHGTASFTVSARRLALGDSVLKVRLINENVARFVDADVDGLVTLTFPANGPETTLTTEIEGVGRGTTVVVVEDNGGHDGVDGSIRVECVTSLVRNASFESSGAQPGVGYGPILAWSNVPGGSGLNAVGMPFFDNGLLPDRNQVAFLQGSRVLSQQVEGLVPGQSYSVQAFYNTRNCCGGTLDFQVRFAGVELAAVPGVTPVGAGQPFHFVSAAFTADATGGLLEFASTAAGDASLLLDGICIVPVNAGEVILKNPSFEASGSPEGVGYMGAMAGWATSGGHGINVDRVGPFSDNGLAGAQDRVAFLQGIASLSQIVEGLTADQDYTLSWLVNARNGDAPGATPYRVLIDGAEVLAEEQTAVGGTNPYARRSVIFKAADISATVRFEGTATTDQSLLLDDIHLFSGSGPVVPLSIAVLQGNSVDIAWPSGAPVNLLLQSSPSMAAGSWNTVESLPFTDGGFNHVLDVIDGAKRFYRLAKP